MLRLCGCADVCGAFLGFLGALFWPRKRPCRALDGPLRVRIGQKATVRWRRVASTTMISPHALHKESASILSASRIRASPDAQANCPDGRSGGTRNGTESRGSRQIEFGDQPEQGRE